LSNAQKITYYLLTNTAGVTALVPATKVFPQRAIRGTAEPYIVYRRVSDNPWQSDDGAGARMARVQVDIYAKEQDDATAIETAVIAAMDRKTPGTYGAELICLSHDGSVDLSDDSADGDGFFHVALDFLINYAV
jgi:hypothetical protein